MADTKRLWSAIQTLLADNITGDISAQDLRDAIYSLEPAYAFMNISSAASTTISVMGTYVKIQGTTTLVASNEFSMPLSNKLQYDGTPDRHVKATYMGCLDPVTDSETWGFRIAKNGTTDANTEISTYYPWGTKDYFFCVQGLFEDFATNDYLELWVANETDTTDLQVNHMTCIVESMFR